ncbi:GNAT family N-acetyltransferase [Sulfurirhabdus autotrophica]|uniref:Putative GNAT family N-acyltransferase n=1 Tax=Sulfurirhabdus autotrophica TaxID=1706046 RepID=A0A4V2W250_9PROT|nr:GNAT family N-acetyltransferase [Sulfurirhabdus autotrophica]TCV86699.1 putative GNAT family N-acyltransferase [Sulfurirhabdus autotrophica]
MVLNEIQIKEVSWQFASLSLREIRSEVFIMEQGVPEALEWDGLDNGCTHLLAITPDNIPVGTVRLLADGHIGRMAVKRTWRNKGVGKALLLRIMEVARIQGIKVAMLNAQTTARGFYEKFGFRAEGNEFLDAGIPHYKMLREL